jgi:hypothetical protein
MLELHIENYKEFFDQKQQLIADEQCKILEYEQLLQSKKIEKSNMFFLKKLFDKNSNDKENEIIEAIQSSTYTISEIKKEIEQRKDNLLQYGKTHIITSNDNNIKQHKQLITEKDAALEINRMTKELEELCGVAIKHLHEAIKTINDTNAALNIGISKQLYKVHMLHINKNLGTACSTISRFKKVAKYSRDQMLNYDITVDTSFYEPLIKIINDDGSEDFVLRDSINEYNRDRHIINNTLAVVHASYKFVKNLNEKHSKRYLEKLATLNNNVMDIELMVKQELKKNGVII